MFYFPGHQLGFFHIPKTGGTAVSEFLIATLRARGDKEREITQVRWHEPIANKASLLGQEVFDQTLILTTVRNPYATVVSLYFWSKFLVGEPYFDPKEYPSTVEVAAMDFAQYIDWYMANEPTYEDYLFKDGAVPQNVRILRLENIDADVGRVLNQELGLGVEVSIPVSNDSRHGPVMSYLDDDSIRRINRKYAWAFETLYPDQQLLT